MVSFLTRFTFMPAFDQLRVAADIARIVIEKKEAPKFFTNTSVYQLLLSINQSSSSLIEAARNTLDTALLPQVPISFADSLVAEFPACYLATGLETIHEIEEDNEEVSDRATIETALIVEDEDTFDWDTPNPSDFRFVEEYLPEESFSVDSEALAGVRSLKSSTSSLSLETFHTCMSAEDRRSLRTYSEMELIELSVLPFEKAAWSPLQVGTLVEVSYYGTSRAPPCHIPPVQINNYTSKKAFKSVRMEDAMAIISQSPIKRKLSASKCLAKALEEKRSFFSWF